MKSRNNKLKSKNNIKWCRWERGSICRKIDLGITIIMYKYDIEMWTDNPLKKSVRRYVMSKFRELNTGIIRDGNKAK